MPYAALLHLNSLKAYVYLQHYRVCLIINPAMSHGLRMYNYCSIP